MELAKVNLKFLQTFLAVARNTSFRAAAQEVFRSQSAVSTQIKQLEEQLGLTLFNRTTRHVELTVEGEQLFESVQRGLGEVESCVSKLRKAVDMRRGEVSISCSPTISATLLPHILSAFELDYPGIKISILDQSLDQMLTSLSSDAVDFAIGPIVKNDDFDFETLLIDDLYAFAPQKFFSDTKTVISLASLANLPILMLDNANALSKLLRDTLSDMGLDLVTKYQFSQASTLIAMASAGLGVAILPASVLPSPEDHPSCQILRIVEPKMARQIGLITRRGEALSRAATRLSELVRELIDSPDLIARPEKRAWRP